MADLKCEDCKRFLRNQDFEVSTRGGIPNRLPLGLMPPCASCPKIPPDAPERTWRYARELNTRLRKAYLHYLECRATGNFPDDPIVRRNARLIREVYDELEARDARRVLARLGINPGLI